MVPTKIDNHPIPARGTEIRAFVSLKNEVIRLPHFLRYYRTLGVDRFFIIDNGSTDGTRQLLERQGDCHVFHTVGSYFEENVSPPKWQNSILNVHGAGGWCLVVDADELLVFPQSETTEISTLCEYLDHSGTTGLIAPLLDMYGDGPIANAAYEPPQPFIEACPYFDSNLGWLDQNGYGRPEMLMFGGVRERAFMVRQFFGQQPPCLTKVPLVRWKPGMEYLVSTHTINDVKVSEIQGTLLHFKFLTGFQSATASSLTENKGIAERGLQERKAYAYALADQPLLRLRTENSSRFEDTEQLTGLGWIRSSPSFESFISRKSTSTRPLLAT